MAKFKVRCAGHGWLTIATDDSGDARYRFSVSSAFLPEFTVPAARDLLRVGQAAFLADRAFRRGALLGGRTRELKVVVPVEDPKRWTRLAESVDRLAGFVSHDRWQFEFVRLGGAPAQRPRPRKLPENACVSLFSGGLDSLCGAAAAFRRGQAPILVTHAPPSGARVAASIARLRQALGGSLPEARWVGFHFQASDRSVEGTRRMFPERTRRTRPMLFLCLAGATALECRVRRIYLNENGVLALNLPFQPDLHGPAITRHAHPETLRRFELVLRDLWEGPDPPVVTNPFASQTKGEQVADLGPAGFLAPETVSCEYAGQQVAQLIGWLRRHRLPYQEVRECGLCSACLVRRAAMSFAHISESHDHYAFDVHRALRERQAYSRYPLYRLVETRAHALQSFCAAMAAMPPSRFVLQYATQLALVAQDSNRVNREAYALCQRFARQVNAFLVAE